MIVTWGANIAVPIRSFRKLVPRAIAGAGNRAGEMAEQAARLARIEHHRHGLAISPCGD